MKNLPRHLLAIVLLLVLALVSRSHAAEPQRPNILFILTDDLGYGDVGVFFQNLRNAAGDRSQPSHLTPHIDTLAAEGMQLRDHYCPAPVCAPSRASLMLGVHQGHANIRDSQFDKALEANHTVASVLKGAGYATGAIGKWGLQGKPDVAAPNGWPAHPMNRGFDSYFGYISHYSGHWHYPKEDHQQLYDGSKDVAADYDCCYTTDLFTARAKKWIGEQKASHPEQPFFLYLAYDTPHAKLQYPPCSYPAGAGKNGGVQWLGKPGRMINTADGKPDSYCHPDYASATWDHDHSAGTIEEPWPDVYKRFATDVRRIDDCVGDLLQFLKDLHIDDNTLVIFTSDNGPSRESYLPEHYEPTFFHSFGPFDGMKRDCWEGGIRVGAIARWPGSVPAGRVSGEPSGFWDWMPTFAELAGVPAPARTDGISLMPTLRGVAGQKPSRIYIEYFEKGKTPLFNEFAAVHRGRVRQQMQTLRLGDFVGVRYNIASHADPFEIYNIVTDPQETTNLAGQDSFKALQQQMKDTVLRVRRPDAEAERPYDNELIPAVKAPTAIAGVQWRLYEQSSPWLAKLDNLKSAYSGTQARPDAVAVLDKKKFALLFMGYIEVPVDGTYNFHLTADKGALLRIHEATVIDADFGYTAGTEVSGAVRLRAGRHPFRLYYNSHAGRTPMLQFKWSSEKFPKQDIPRDAFFHDAPPK